MSSSASIRLMQQVRFSSALEDKAGARDQKDLALSEQKDKIGEVYEQRLTKIDKDREAREADGLGRLIGTLVCPLVGTLIGGAIGHAAGGGDRDAAAAAQKEAGLSGIERDQASDAYGKALESYEAAASDVQGIEKFGRELRAEATRSSAL
jgi:hypothetical protein